MSDNKLPPPPPTSPSFDEIITALASSGSYVARTFLTPDDPVRRSFSPELEAEVAALQAEITNLRKEIADKAHALGEEQIQSSYKDGYIRGLTTQLANLHKKQTLAHLLERVSPEAKRKLFDSPELRSAFERDDACPAYVLSIDIRRSTELMLKARTPRLFAEFIVGLAQALRDVVVTNHGIFDKFTGDGILAFFPEFFSGPGAGYLVLRAATQAHEVFKTHYDTHRNCFLAVLRDTGLGIGIDHGAVSMVHLGTDFTVVGTPVVYACRMAGAKAGHTYLNQPAYEQIVERYSAISNLGATELDVKNEGTMLAYAATLKSEPFEPAPPGWATFPTAG